MIPRRLLNFSLFVDGVGYAGRVEELTPPKLSRKMEEYRGGGMDAPIDIDMGQEKLEAEFTLAEYSREVLNLYGKCDSGDVKLRFKGFAQRQDGSCEPEAIEIVIQGRWKEIDSGNWKAGDNATMKVSVTCGYYRYMSMGQELIEIDVLGSVFKVNGKDKLLAQRIALDI